MLTPIVIWVIAGLLGCAGLVIFLMLLADAYARQADAEAAEDRQGPPPRDITIGKDQYQPDRMARLRGIQGGDTDVSRKAHPVEPMKVKQRRASSDLTRGF